MTGGKKGDEFRKLADELIQPPQQNHSIGRCQECEAVVMIDTGLRQRGMAKQCEEHRPLCQFQVGNSH